MLPGEPARVRAEAVADAVQGREGASLEEEGELQLADEEVHRLRYVPAKDSKLYSDSGNGGKSF